MTNSRSQHDRLNQLGLVIILLLAQLVLRVHHVALQVPYVDEGLHNMLATDVWKLNLLPEHLQDGRILLYYYLNFFVAGGTTALFISRAAIGLASLASGAVVYGLARRFHSHAAGIVALALYAVLPYTFFHERMVLADPLATGFMCLVAWRSVIFAHRPRWRDGIFLGVLLTAATMAKLTAVLMPVLPVMATIIFFPQMSGPFAKRVEWWLRRYFPPLALAAVIMLILWMPFLAFAYSTRGTPQQFGFVASMAVGSTVAPFTYIAAMLHDTMAYTSAAFYVAVALGALYFIFARKLATAGFFLLFWLASVTLLTFSVAAIVAPRYILPAAAPAVMLVAIASVDLWQRASPQLLFRVGLLAVAGIWLLTFAGPFILTAMSQPEQLPLPSSDYSYYLGGTFSADETAIQAAHMLDGKDPLIHIDPKAKVVYGDWVICRLVYYFMARPITCLLENIYKQQLATLVKQDLAPGDDAYLIMIDTGPNPDGVEGVCSSPFVKYTRADRFSLVIWRLQRAPCGP